MRAVIQRVSRAAVHIGGRNKAAIGPGLLVLLGIEEADTFADIEWLSAKIVALRIFNDANGIMNVPIKELGEQRERREDSRERDKQEEPAGSEAPGGEILLVSQFTLHASTKKGNRPSYIRAARPETARPLYEAMILRLEEDLGKKIQTGEFGADMQVELVNDGPVTIIIDTKNRE